MVRLIPVLRGAQFNSQKQANSDLPVLPNHGSCSDKNVSNPTNTEKRMPYGVVDINNAVLTLHTWKVICQITVHTDNKK